jgi:hypothetical protein
VPGTQWKELVILSSIWVVTVLHLHVRALKFEEHHVDWRGGTLFQEAELLGVEEGERREAQVGVFAILRGHRSRQPKVQVSRSSLQSAAEGQPASQSSSSAQGQGALLQPALSLIQLLSLLPQPLALVRPFYPVLHP